MQVFLGLAFFIMGIVQWFAIVDGLKYAFSLGTFFAFIISAILTYIPLVGPAFGVYGAVNAWHWPLLQSLALFFWIVPLYVVAFIYDIISKR